VVRSSSIAVAETTNAEIATRAALITNEVLMPAIKESNFSMDGVIFLCHKCVYEYLC
jgi:hypothetical protein